MEKSRNENLIRMINFKIKNKMSNRKQIGFFAYLLAVVLSSCDRGIKHEKIIVTKNYSTFMDNPMPNGICRFWYREYDTGEAQEFQDSCYKYNVGDTLVGRSKNYR